MAEFPAKTSDFLAASGRECPQTCQYPDRQLCRQLLPRNCSSQQFAALVEEAVIVGPAVVGVGPGAFPPGAAMEVERDLREDAAVEIQPVVAVFGGREDELGLGEIAGVDVKRPRLRMVAGGLVLLLPGVGTVLEVDDGGRIDSPLECEEGLEQPGTHRRLVEGG